MKFKTESVTTLFLVLLLQTVVRASSAGLLKSQSLMDALGTLVRRESSFELGVATNGILEDLLLPKEISQVTTSFAKPGHTVSNNQVNACNLSEEVLAQILKPTPSQWLVDDETIELLHNDLQLLIECTRPRDRIIFLTSKRIKLARTVEIVHELQLIGTISDVQGAQLCSDQVTSFTCPQTGPAFSVRSTKFLATSLHITNCKGSSRNAVMVLGENSISTLYRLSIKDNANRAILVGDKANLLMVEVNLEKNEVGSHGAAMFVSSNSHSSILKSNFRGNAATDDSSAGAVLFNYNNIAFIKGCTFADNTCEDDGGALYLNYDNVISIQGSTFTNNTAKDCSGVIAAIRNCTFNILQSVFANNNCQRAGGAMCLDYDMDITIQESTFANNTAQGDGGVLSIFKAGKISINESSFTNNTSNFRGGVIRLYEESSVSAIGSTFTDNICKASGGAMHAITKCIVMIQRSTISNNDAGTGAGGGIYLDTNNTLTTISSTIVNNTASDGGALNLYKSNALGIQGCTLNDNTAKIHGGALYLDTNNMGAIFDSSLANNHAGNSSGPYGAAIYSRSSSNSLLLLNSDITRKENGKTLVTYRSLTKDDLNDNVYKRYHVLEVLQWPRKYKNAA